jgi:hypothetical protein
MKDWNEISGMLGKVSGSRDEMLEQLQEIQDAVAERQGIYTRYFDHLKSLEAIWRAMLDGRLNHGKEDVEILHFRAVTKLAQFIDFDELGGEITSLVIGGMLHLMAMEDDDE